MKEGRRKELSTTQLIALGFLSAILVGTFLLSFPIATVSGERTPLIDALFTATTSVCVTGLVVVDTYAHWSLFGQIVILLLIQCGGLGIATLTTSVMVLIGKRINLKDRMLLEDAFNLNTLSGLIRFLKKIVKGTFVVEGIGAILYAFVFIPQFGIWKGIQVSVFNAVSAFCNAGMDIIGDASLAAYVSQPLVNLVTMLLIVIGGIGYIVWWDIIRVGKMCRQKEIAGKQFFRKLCLHTKIVLVTTAGLILFGMCSVFCLEYNNPNTLGELSLSSKIMAAAFQSVTVRTAGFFTIPQQEMRDATALICMILMFIGGSPVGTAGGIKTTTAALLFIATLSIIKGTEEAVAFKRRIPLYTVRKALAVTLISVLVMMTAMTLLLVLEQGLFIDIAYETVSAIGTVGLSRNFTASLNTIGRVIIIICMYLGRIGPISLAIAFQFKRGKDGLITYPQEEVTVG